MTSTLTKNIKIQEMETICDITNEDIFLYVDYFYSILLKWEDEIIFKNKKENISLILNKRDYDEFSFKNNNLNLSISNSSIEYIISQLMYYNHFGFAQASHIHIEFKNKNNKDIYELTFFFKDFEAPLSAEETEKIINAI